MDKEDGKKPLKFKFNHESSDFLKAIGITEKIATERGRAIAAFFRKTSEKRAKRSQILEDLINSPFTKEDLAFFLHESVSGNLRVEGSPRDPEGFKVFGGKLCPEHAEELFNKLRELGVDVPKDVGSFNQEEMDKLAKAAALQKIFKDLL